MGIVSAPASGTQPEGVRDEREASAYVRRMFSQIAPRYDLLNHLLSLNLDKLWRARTAKRFGHIVGRPDARVLDLCCGTGDLTFALRNEGRKDLTPRAQRYGGHGGGELENPGAQFFGSDFAHPMLTRACEKARADNAGVSFSSPTPMGADNASDRGQLKLASTSARSARVPQFAEGDALQLPFADGTFDLVTAAFGFRNLANYEAGLREIHRVLKRGGEVGILEFAAPRDSIFASLFKLYFTQVLPRIGRAVSGSSAAYSYLPASVMKFPPPEALACQMTAAGFSQARFEAWTFGVVALHMAQKP